MPGERLFEFAVDLGEYLLDQVRSPLRALPARPVAAPRLHPTDWYDLDLPAWLGRGVAGLPPRLADHVWAGVAGDPPRLPLGDAEAAALVWAVDDPPPRAERDGVWAAGRGLHRRAAGCLREVRAELSRATADEWADASAGLAARLEAGRLSLAAGAAAVHDWLGEAWRLLDAMGAADYLPAPAGTRPTPTRPTPGVPAGRQPRAGGPARSDGLPAPELLDPAGVARRFAVSRSTLYAACRAGRLAHYRVPARPGARGKYLLRVADVTAWLDTLRVADFTPPPDPPAASSPAAPFSELDVDRLRRAWKD